MYDVFDAKVAEVVPGVGYVWDWKILVAGKRPQNIPEKINHLIDILWISSNRSPYSEKLGKRETPRRGWKKELEAFETKILSPIAPKPSRKARDQA
jgi:hypothetical protein